MVTEEVIKSGELYNASDAELYEVQWRLNDLMYEYNQTRPSNRRKQQEILKELLGDLGEDCVIEPPLRANWGKNTHIGDNVYVNFNLTLVDDADIYIGSHVMIGQTLPLQRQGIRWKPNSGIKECSLTSQSVSGTAYGSARE